MSVAWLYVQAQAGAVFCIPSCRDVLAFSLFFTLPNLMGPLSSPNPFWQFLLPGALSPGHLSHQSSAGGMDSVPGQGTKILACYTVSPKKKKKD